MIPVAKPPPAGMPFVRGMVVSDLHLFAARSGGEARFAAVRDSLRELDVLVLNGDIFDFRWSCLADPATTQVAALAWLRDLATSLPDCRIHYVLGNHDCLAGFAQALADLADVLRNFQWHEYVLRLGSAVFVHGDCAHATMDAAGLDRYRQAWRHDRQRGRFAARAYLAADWLGLTRVAHQWHFPRGRTVGRVAHYLDDALPGWRATTRDCYFGHTHLPFAGHGHDGMLFHNTGSAIRGMSFKPAVFSTSNAS